MADRLATFLFDGEQLTVNFVETLQVKEGVSCDVYTFADDDTKDLAIVTVTKGASTPLQLVLRGEQTIEGHVSGSGTLRIWSKDGHVVAHKSPRSQEVKVGEKMQWTADGDSDLVFFEVCAPPYKDGRFQNLPE